MAMMMKMVTVVEKRNRKEHNIDEKEVM